MCAVAKLICVRFSYRTCQSPLRVILQGGFPSPQQQEDDQSIPGEWDEFDNVQPMHGKRPEDAKNAFDNPGNADDTNVVKKDVQNQIQETNTQMSFKVNRRCFLFSLLLNVHFLKMFRLYLRIVK